MQFTKMHGCGNDYVYINCFEEEVLNPSELSIKLSNRHTGIGSDGLVLIMPSKNADVMMDIYNMDGSRAMMCGNAIRCVGKYVYEHGIKKNKELTVETLSGIKYLKLAIDENNHLVNSVTVDMGSPITEPALIPLNISVLDKIDAEELISMVPNGSAVIKDLPLWASDKNFTFTCVSMGNPHAVTFVEDTADLDIEKIGPILEHNGVFPERANIEFVQIIDRNTVRMRVWERGSNETRACGTGACATAYAAIMNNFTDDTVCVKMLGGELIISYNREDNKIYMMGPAVEVFCGETLE